MAQWRLAPNKSCLGPLESGYRAAFRVSWKTRARRDIRSVPTDWLISRYSISVTQRSGNFAMVARYLFAFVLRRERGMPQLIW